MWPVAGERRDGWRALVEALEKVSVLRDPAGRELCLDLLSQYLGLSLQVRQFPSPRHHLYSILLACDQHPSALQMFMRVLSELEPGSRAVQFAQQMLTEEVPRQRTEAVRTGETGHIPGGRPPPVWGGLPPRNVNFVGRTYLLDAIPGTPAVLHGMGGVGKSQVAVEYAYRHAADYDLIWWIPAGEPTQIQTSLIELAMRLRLPVEPSTQSAVPAVLAALGDGDPYRDWLLIFDNADHPDVVRPFLPAGPGQVLVLSRTAQWPGNLIGVNVFTRSESVELLRRHNPELTDSEADQLAGALDDLPLAVDLAGRTGMSAADYLRLLTDKRAAWTISMDQLRTDNPGAFDLLRVCAFFAPEPISRDLFAAGPALPSFVDLEDTLRDEILLNRAIREINKYGLARVDHRNGTIQLHRLVRLALQEQHAECRHLAHLILAGADPNQPDSAENWSRYADLMPHVLAGQAADSADQRVRRLAINTLVFLFTWGDPDCAKDMAAELVSQWREQLGPHHRDTLVASRWFGRTLRQAGQFEEARLIGMGTLALLQQHFGDDHEETLLSVHAAASDLRAKGDFEEARKLDEDAYRRTRARFGDDDPDTLAAADNYALSLRLCGLFEAARELDEDTCDRKACVLGENHRHTLSTLDSLAADLVNCGDWAEACRVQEDTVRRFREHVGVRDPMTLLATKNLAVARRMAGDFANALPLGQVALDGLASRYGRRHPDAISAAMNVSVNLRQLGRLEEARQQGLHVHELYEEAWGDYHPFTLAAATNLAVTMHALGEMSTARGLNEKAWSRMRTVLGEDHPFSLVCATNLANDLARGGQYAAARDLGLDTLDRSRRVLPADHPSTLAVATNLALDLRGLGLLDESAELQRDTLARLHAVLGSQHPATVGATDNRRAFCDIDAAPI